MSTHPDVLQITQSQTAQYTWIIFLPSSHTGICPWIWEFIPGAQPWSAGKDNLHHIHMNLRCLLSLHCSHQHDFMACGFPALLKSVTMSKPKCLT